MSSKSKRITKVSVKLRPGEAFVVADTEYFVHMEQVYRILATEAATQEDAAKWLEVADLIAHWVYETAVPVTDIYDDDDDW